MDVGIWGGEDKQVCLGIKYHLLSSSSTEKLNEDDDLINYSGSKQHNAVRNSTCFFSCDYSKKSSFYDLKMYFSQNFCSFFFVSLEEVEEKMVNRRENT